MTEASEWQRPTDSGDSPSSARSTSAAGGAAGGSRPQGPGPAGSATGDPSQAGPSEAVLGPFTLRELIFGGGVLLVFVGTLLPYIEGLALYSNFWNTTSLFFIGIGILVPVAALALLAGRRMGAAGLRVGSLSVDQFASVSSVLAATFFFLQTVVLFHIGPFLSLLGALVMVVSTVLAPFLPVLRTDFAERPEATAHVLARPMTAARPRPRPEKPAGAKAGSPAVSSPASSSPATSSSATSSSAASAPGGSSSADRQDRRPVNPAAADVRQNGAGLYGAGGAGVVGAGPAASGQSGLRPGAARDDRTDRGANPGAPADGRPSAEDHSARVSGGSSAPRDDSHGSDPLDESAVSGTPGTDRTRVNEVVREDTRSDAAPVEDDSARTTESSRQEPITATRAADEEPVVEAFWFAVGSSRPVYDEQNGYEVFTLEPGDWEVGIEDRGDEFLVQDKRTGAMGVLRDLDNIERAPRD